MLLPLPGVAAGGVRFRAGMLALGAAAGRCCRMPLQGAACGCWCCSSADSAAASLHRCKWHAGVLQGAAAVCALECSCSVAQASRGAAGAAAVCR